MLPFSRQPEMCSVPKIGKTYDASHHDQSKHQPDYTKKCERMRLKNEIETISDFQITEMRFEKEKQKLIGKIIKAKGSNHYKNPKFPA